MNGSEGEGGRLSFGLFGSVNVEPEGAEYYRSEVTNADLKFDGGRLPRHFDSDWLGIVPGR